MFVAISFVFFCFSKIDIIKISGWPKVQILSNSWYEILILIIISTGCFLLPILISCFIYLKLICNKKKWFQNRVSLTNEGSFDKNLDVTNPEGSINQELASIVPTQSKREIEVEKNMQKIFELQQEEKCKAQVSSALRALQTNFALFVLLSIIFWSLIFVSKRLSMYISVVGFSVMKAAMPLLTTLLNFRTVQSAVNQYWNYIKQKNCML